MVETPPTAANMRLDGGHPALDLVNTIYGRHDGPVEVDVLAEPADLVTFAHRVALAPAAAPASAAALRDAHALRDALYDVLTRGADAAPVEAAARAALAAARLVRRDGAFAWTWGDDDPHAPVHRLAHAALELLTD